jgi:heptaprenyl diphosphate synthase
MTLIALVNMGERAALEVAILRTLVSSFVLGTFLSPSFILSFSGALASSLAMCALYKILTGHGRPELSLLSVSLTGAIVHAAAQLGVVYLLFIKHTAVFLLLPWLGISAIITGWITGLLAAGICRRLRCLPGDVSPAAHAEKSLVHGGGAAPRDVQAAPSPFYGVSPALKIAGTVVAGIAIILSKSFLVYAAFFLLLSVVAYRAGIPFRRLSSNIRRLASFILFSFAVGVVSNGDGTALFAAGSLKITGGGLVAGSLIAFRLVLLMLSASLLSETMSREELSAGLRKCLLPLRIFGISPAGPAAIVALSVSLVPGLLDEFILHIKNANLRNKRLADILPVVSDIVVIMCEPR